MKNEIKGKQAKKLQNNAWNHGQSAMSIPINIRLYVYLHRLLSVVCSIATVPLQVTSSTVVRANSKSFIDKKKETKLYELPVKQILFRMLLEAVTRQTWMIQFIRYCCWLFPKWAWNCFIRSGCVISALFLLSGISPNKSLRTTAFAQIQRHIERVLCPIAQLSNELSDIRRHAQSVSKTLVSYTNLPIIK